VYREIFNGHTEKKHRKYYNREINKKKQVSMKNKIEIKIHK